MVFVVAGPSNVHVWALGLSCETPTALGPPGLHATTRELQTCTFESPGLRKHHQNSTRRHPERDKKNENRAGEAKKRAKFWAPHPSGPCPSGRTLRGPQFGAPKFRARFSLGLGPPFGPHLLGPPVRGLTFGPHLLAPP